MNFTIIIPAYRQQETLPDAIESALLQKCEVIVIDDGSPDKSAEIAESYGVKVIRQVNKGLASARNTGIMNASGDIIIPLDSDDELLVGYKERVAQEFEKGADIVAPSFKQFGVANDPVILHPNPKLEDFATGNYIPYFSAFRKDRALAVGGYSPRMTWGYEDLHFWINLLSRGAKLVTIPDVLALYRTKADSMITEALKHHDELMGQIRKDFPTLYV